MKAQSGAGGSRRAEIRDWRYYYQQMLEKAPLVIYYPTCGGGEECITACPFSDKVWTVVPMKVPLFGIRYRVRLRPYMAHPENCKRCYICIAACPTGALSRSDNPPKHPWLRFIAAALKLPFKKRYGPSYVFREEHKEKFRQNNSPELARLEEQGGTGGGSTQ